MWQQVVIAGFVLIAASYVIWTFLSMNARQRLLDKFASRGLLMRFAAQHRARLAAPGCSNCPAGPEHTYSASRRPR